MSQTKVQLVDFGSAVAASTPTNGPFISAANTVSISTNSTERFKISSTGEATVLGGNLTLNAQGDLRLADADSSNFIALQAPSTISSNVTLTLPSADGTNGQALTTNGSGTLSFTTISTTSDKITEGNTEAEVVDTGSDGHFKVITEGTERFRCDSSGRLLVGTSTARANFFGGSGTAMSQIEGTGSGSSASRAALSIINNNNNTNECAYFVFGKSSGSSLGSNTLVANNEFLGLVTFQGSDGTKFVQAASIAAQVDGTPGVNDMPGRLVFSTTADGASSPTERMRINTLGALKVSTVGTYLDSNSIVHEFGHDNAINPTVQIRAASGSYTGEVLRITCDRNTANGTYNLITARNGSGSNRFVVADSGNCANINNSYGALSDLKLKENIVDANPQWDDLKALQVRNYNFKEDPDHRQIGVIAQEIELVSPGLVTESPDRDAEGNDLGTVTKAVNYSVLYMKAVKALQEAMERIEQLEAEMAEVKAQLS